MSEFNYLTGRKELFDNAPPEAMVVLETNDGQVYYAVSHNRGAQYWYDNGNPGRPIGLIALFEKTRVVASRARVHGSAVAPAAKPTPVPASRAARMQSAQDSLRKAVSHPAPVAPKPEAKPAPKPAPVKLDPPKVEPKFKAVDDGKGLGNMVVGDAVTGKPIDGPAPDIAVGRMKLSDAGFVSAFDMSFRMKSYGTPGITLYRNGNMGLSSNLFETGDLLDVQVNVASCVIRVGKVKTGGRVLKKSRVFSGKALVRLIGIPEGSNSIRINLTEQDGWFVGTFTKAGGAK
jgi:hypothetical protein